MPIPWHKQKVTLPNLLTCATACVLQLLRAWMCANNNHTIQPLSVRHRRKMPSPFYKAQQIQKKNGLSQPNSGMVPQLVSSAVGSIKPKSLPALNWWNAANRGFSTWFFVMSCFPLDSLLYGQPTPLGCDCSGNSQGEGSPGMLKDTYDSSGLHAAEAMLIPSVPSSPHRPPGKQITEFCSRIQPQLLI